MNLLIFLVVILNSLLICFVGYLITVIGGKVQSICDELHIKDERQAQDLH